MNFPIEIIFVSKKRNSLRNIRLNLSLIIVLVITFIITISSLILFIYNTNGTFTISSVEQENEILLRKLDSLNFFLRNTQDNFKQQIARDNRERTFWQMDDIHPDIWSMGIGGKTYEPPNQSLSDRTNRMLSEIYESINILKGKSFLRKACLREIQDKIEKNLLLWAHIPSINPVPGRRLGSGFGYRVDPINKEIRMHWGIDIGAPRDTPIRASADGVVSRTGWNKGYGWTIDIDHGFGFKTRYAHCRSMFVKEGDTVKRGQAIATVGATGRTTSPNLHYEVYISGVKVNPRHYINQSSVVFD